MQEGIDFVRCRICGLEMETLSRHLAIHGITAEEYHIRFPDAKVVCDKVRDGRSDKLRAKLHKEPTLTCRYCGAVFQGRVQRRAHERREEAVFLNGEEGKDFIVCRECGFRDTKLVLHLKGQHGMTTEEYRAKHPGASVVIGTIVRQQGESNVGKHSIPTEERFGAVLCDKCGEWYLQRYAANHLQECVAKCPEKYVKDYDYVACPECRLAFTRMGAHLKSEHGWDDDRLKMESNAGLRLMAKKLVDQWVGANDIEGIRQKREATMLTKYGVANPFSSPEVQKKIRQTNRRRYGTDHPMQNEDVFIRQQQSAGVGPSALEAFFDEHTCLNVVYTGYGGRLIRCKEPVRKYGREFRDLCPDFMVFPDNVLESARSASEERRRLDRKKHRTRWVIELLGDWYHSEAVIGVPPEQHEAEVMAAYASVGIECLVLWEHEVLAEWEQTRTRVEAWIERAVADINANPVWRKPSHSKC